MGRVRCRLSDVGRLAGGSPGFPGRPAVGARLEGTGMLTQLVALLKDASRGLSIAEISRALTAQPAAVAGMLDWLARAGRLIEVGPDGGFCGSCGLETECQLLRVHGKRYILARQASSGASASEVGQERQTVLSAVPETCPGSDGGCGARTGQANKSSAARFQDLPTRRFKACT
jgi:hypothetical protein